MKKIFALLLSLVMIVTVFAGCESTGNSTETTGAAPAPKGVFEAGYGRVDVTPDEKNSMNLAGHGYDRFSIAVWDPLYITCVALKDEDGNTFLLYHCDFLKAYVTLNMSKRQIAAAANVPVENIMIATTHNHSAPGLDDTDSSLTVDYAQSVRKALVKAAEDAIADLKPAKAYTTEIDVDNMNGIRSIGVSSNFEDELDATMELIKFTREGGKDIVLMNWQGHPRGHGDSKDAMNAILSDVDAIRRCIEPALDCHFAFFLGASGNVNNIASSQTYVIHGKLLSGYAVKAAPNFKEVEDGVIRKVTTKVEVDYKTGGKTENVLLSTIAIGKSIAFVIVPYEMFSSSAKEIKAYSQFDQTFIVTCADSHYGYMPTEATADDEYEVGATSYARGTAERLVEGYLDLLDQLLAE